MSILYRYTSYLLPVFNWPPSLQRYIQSLH